MEAKDLQRTILEFHNKWHVKRKTVPDEQRTFNHLVEEVGELAREYVNKESRPDRYSEAEVENAIGDIFMQLVQLAHIRGLNIEDVVLKIIKEEEEMFFKEK